MWKTTGNMSIVALGGDFFAIKFMEEQDFVKIISGGPWFFNRNYLAIRLWEPNFSPSRENFYQTECGLLDHFKEYCKDSLSIPDRDKNASDFAAPDIGEIENGFNPIDRKDKDHYGPWMVGKPRNKQRTKAQVNQHPTSNLVKNYISPELRKPSSTFNPMPSLNFCDLSKQGMASSQAPLAHNHCEYITSIPLMKATSKIPAFKSQNPALLAMGMMHLWKKANFGTFTMEMFPKEVKVVASDQQVTLAQSLKTWDLTTQSPIANLLSQAAASSPHD
ncbi:hypothetical protein ACH5RR_006510 [Cinchona calisaya]|uniref:DUF4283 domain-containing protein n=1 Tax=Cinchona calisaya TaxID=153742 RepID=A0ABD3AP92_9GENT